MWPEKEKLTVAKQDEVTAQLRSQRSLLVDRRLDLGVITLLDSVAVEERESSS